MAHLASPGAWKRAGMGGELCGLCWPSFMSVFALHPDAEFAPAMAQQVEGEVLRGVAEQRRTERGARSGLLSRMGPQEPFVPVDPDAPFDFEGLIG